MKKILKEGSKFRIKCPYCDCEFEYESDDIFYGEVLGVSVVSCPNCHNILNHKDSLKSNIITEQL